MNYDYEFFEMTDQIKIDGKWKNIQDGTHRFAVRKINDFPENLINQRKRISRISQIRKDAWDAQGRLYLVRANQAKKKDLIRYGVQFDENGAFIDKQSDVLVEFIQPYLPNMINSTTIGELIPATSWGASLHNLLIEDDWQKIRNFVLTRSDNRCEICGKTGSLECHEQWAYSEPATEENNKLQIGIQTLTALQALCPACHEIHHLGFANRNGYLERAMTHIGNINNWNSNEVAQYCKYIFTTWERRSSYAWILYPMNIPSDFITINPKWSPDEKLFITSRTNTGKSITKIFGVAWKILNQTDIYQSKGKSTIIRAVSDHQINK